MSNCAIRLYKLFVWSGLPHYNQYWKMFYCQVKARHAMHIAMLYSLSCSTRMPIV